MSDTQVGDEGQQQVPPVIINGQYIKDLSFESPNVPDIFGEMQGKQPDINITVDVKIRPVSSQNDAAMHEVVLQLHAAMKIGEKVGFIVELQYAGIFTLNVAEEHTKPVLLIECPRILFPYARQILSDATQQGGFMPLYLQPIDFAAMYQAGQKNELDSIDADVAKMSAEQNKD